MRSQACQCPKGGGVGKSFLISGSITLLEFETILPIMHFHTQSPPWHHLELWSPSRGRGNRLNGTWVVVNILCIVLWDPTYKRVEGCNWLFRERNNDGAAMVTPENKNHVCITNYCHLKFELVTRNTACTQPPLVRCWWPITSSSSCDVTYWYCADVQIPLTALMEDFRPNKDSFKTN